ncbi:MAG: TIGR03752 family integrating conjugative element protein, partial [Geminicoccaceae bacterium]
MNRLKGNAVLPVLVTVVLVTMGSLAAKSLLSDDTVKPQPRTALPKPDQEPDSDTPSDTIRTLNAQLVEVNERLEELNDHNQTLEKENEQLRDSEKRIRADVSAELEKKLATTQREQSNEYNTSLNRLGKQFADLQASLTVNPQKAETPSTLTSPDAYPVAGTLGQSADFGNLGYVWVEPLDAGQSTISSADTEGLNPLSDDGIPSSFETLGNGLSIVDDKAAPADPTPYFTINNLATLAGSTAFTAMIGRVPIGGQVSDPVPFRVLVGRENLAASGLRVPNDIASMVFEGVAIGDWTLGCVEGSLRTATFVFEDGTIRTVDGGDGQGRLGYIADKFGTPCVAGERISNAGPYLTAAVGLAAGAGAAEAFAAAET